MSGPGVLVLNVGSSSIKCERIEMPGETRAARAAVTGLGGGRAELVARDGDRSLRRSLPDGGRAGALAALFDWLADRGLDRGLAAVGHRVVHGGESLVQPALVDAAVRAQLEHATRLAPLHNRANLAGIELAAARLPGVPQVAVFDTAFHHDLPDVARYYALPLDVQRELGIRRYGFHGLSHGHVAGEAARLLNRPLESLRLVSLHLGSGASACAIRAGRSIDTSMGFTPLEGLVMATRCGDLDPALPGLVAAHLGLDAAGLDRWLNQSGGLAGLCGDADMRRVEARRAAGDADAERAFELYCYRVRKYVGAYCAALGGLDALIFTGGVGEASAAVRAAVCRGLEALGIRLDAQRNAAARPPAAIGAPGAPVAVLVVPSDEALEIARATWARVAPLA